MYDSAMGLKNEKFKILFTFQRNLGKNGLPLKKPGNILNPSSPKYQRIFIITLIYLNYKKLNNYLLNRIY